MSVFEAPQGRESTAPAGVVQRQNVYILSSMMYRAVCFPVQLAERQWIPGSLYVTPSLSCSLCVCMYVLNGKAEILCSRRGCMGDAQFSNQSELSPSAEVWGSCLRVTPNRLTPCRSASIFTQRNFFICAHIPLWVQTERKRKRKLFFPREVYSPLTLGRESLKSEAGGCASDKTRETGCFSSVWEH